MLVLSRKVGERIHVGDDIVLEIRRIAGNRVTLALEAPRNVRILRGELDQAAREFRPANGHDHDGHCHETLAIELDPSVATASPITVLHTLPAEAVGRHLVT